MTPRPAPPRQLHTPTGPGQRRPPAPLSRRGQAVAARRARGGRRAPHRAGPARKKTASSPPRGPRTLAQRPPSRPSSCCFRSIPTTHGASKCRLQPPAAAASTPRTRPPHGERRAKEALAAARRAAARGNQALPTSPPPPEAQLASKPGHRVPPSPWGTEGHRRPGDLTSRLQGAAGRTRRTQQGGGPREAATTECSSPRFASPPPRGRPRPFVRDSLAHWGRNSSNRAHRQGSLTRALPGSEGTSSPEPTLPIAPGPQSGVSEAESVMMQQAASYPPTAQGHLMPPPNPLSTHNLRRPTTLAQQPTAAEHRNPTCPQVSTPDFLSP